MATRHHAIAGTNQHTIGTGTKKSVCVCVWGGVVSRLFCVGCGDENSLCNFKLPALNSLLARLFPKTSQPGAQCSTKHASVELENERETQRTSHARRVRGGWYTGLRKAWERRGKCMGNAWEVVRNHAEVAVREEAAGGVRVVGPGAHTGGLDVQSQHTAHSTSTAHSTQHKHSTSIAQAQHKHSTGTNP